MEPPDSPSPPPDWLLLPENVTVAIFDFLSPRKLLFLRQVCTRWQHLAEASAQTRDKLVLIQCGCENMRNNGKCGCTYKLIYNIFPDQFLFHHELNADGTKYIIRKNEDCITLNAKVNGIVCQSFDWKNAQLLARLFPQISHFTIVHTSITAGHIDQICYLLTQWSPTLTAFKFHSDYNLENPNKRVTRSLAVGTANPPTETYLNSQLTRLFRQLKSLPELKHLALNYVKGKINSTVSDFAFLPRLQELQLDRTTLEANLQAACQRYLAPTVPGAPHPVLRRFAHRARQIDSTAREFLRFLEYSPEALPLATASTWHQRFVFNPTNLPNFLHRFSSLRFLNIHLIQGVTLGLLSRSLSSLNVAVLCLVILGTNPVEEDAIEDTVPMPSVRGLTICLHSPDHARIQPLLAKIPTAFPCLSSLFLLDSRIQCSNDITGPPFTTTADKSRGFDRFAEHLLAICPIATQPIKHQQVQTFLTIARQINASFSNLTRIFQHQNIVLRVHSSETGVPT